MSYIFTSKKRIAAVKELVKTDRRLKRELEDLAEEYMKTTPLSVTFHKSPAASGNPHDYFSEGTYWWPDEKNPNGPYIRRDGEVNPNVFKHHLEDMGRLSNAVCALSQAGLFLGKTEYYKKAVELIKVWFLDEETKMSPHLQYAQAIRGVCNGRGIGIIDTVKLIKVVNGANIIEEAGLYTTEISLLKEWFRQYTHWLNTSENGLEEKNYFNNHANWWNTQVAAYCAFTGDEMLLNECFEKYKTDILVNQVDSEGKFIDEITRTRSYTYSIYNMTACAIICEIAYHKGIDLWGFEASNGNSLKKCIEFFKPFYDNPFLWEYRQINDHGAYGEKLPFRLAAERYNDEELKKINEKRRKDFIPCSQITEMGILDLI
ncbi:MAG: alginate lyase family protein [Acutalibacteraceae bacterium]|jgi:hypothetical protein